MTGTGPKKAFNVEAGKQLAHICSRSGATPDKIQALLDAGADPDYRPHDWADTPLMEVVRCQKDPELARVLIHAGADVMLRGDNNHMPLGKTTKASMIGALLEKDAARQLSATHWSSGTHLSHAVVDLDADCVIAMLEAGADPAGAKNKDYPPLHWAIERGDERKIDALLACNPETQINYAEKREGYNPAMKLFNTRWSFKDALKIHYCTLLMKLGTDLRHRDHQKRTLLDHIEESPDAVRIPLKKAYDDALFNQEIARAVGCAVPIPPRSAMKRKGPV